MGSGAKGGPMHLLRAAACLGGYGNSLCVERQIMI